MSSNEIPTTASLSARYFCSVAFNWGNSCRHGLHHDAQKLRITGRPRSDASETRFPSSVRSVKSGAGWPTWAVAEVSTKGFVFPDPSDTLELDEPDDPESPADATANAVTPATTSTTTAAAASSRPRRRRGAGSGGADEDVDGNGGKEQRQVRVREREEPDGPLRVRVAQQTDGGPHERDPE